MPWFDVSWKSRGAKAQCPSDPYFPDGVDADLSNGRSPCCVERLPYPAPEVGVWLIVCTRCGLAAAVTAAGRRDDPRSVTVACLPIEPPADA